MTLFKEGTHLVTTKNQSSMRPSTQIFNHVQNIYKITSQATETHFRLPSQRMTNFKDPHCL